MKTVRRTWQIGTAAVSFVAWSLARRWRLVRSAQTPGQRCVEQIDRDMRLALLAARIAPALVPAIRRYRPAALINEVWRNLKREIDFRLEARNERFAEALREVPGIKVPALEEHLCGDTVPVMERSHGARVDQVSDRALGRTLARRFIDACVRDGCARAGGRACRLSRGGRRAARDFSRMPLAQWSLGEAFGG
ncbi:MAG TPA: AarF/UbiB family protein [Burkholderiaceae bacterium]|nr:AarF/UbiB family protein [Burkholderiaceae bacterium]